MKGIFLTTVALLTAFSSALNIPASQFKDLNPRDPLPTLNGSHLIQPNDPPGFTVLVNLDDTPRLLTTEKVYLAAIAVVADWASEGWDYAFPARGPRASKASYGVEVSYKSIAYPQKRYQLQVKYLVLGMLHLINQMTKVEKFCRGTAYVVMREEPMGYVELRVSGDPPRTNDVLEENLTATGRIIDPTDSAFTIKYDVNGEPMSCVDLLSTTLYAVATAAQGGSDEYCQDLAGFNEKRSVVFQILGIRPTVSMQLLGYGLARRGLNLLARKLYHENACGEVKFSFYYHGDVLGGGSIRLSDFAGTTTRS
ncbi:MAG: hypothetical protein Q9170_007130 [Blastenia crenularia]